MNHFEIVLSEAMGHHGIFTFLQAKKLGIVKALKFPGIISF